MRDDSNNSVIAGARGALALIGAQRPAPHRTRRPRTESRPAPRRPRRVALARAALASVLALASPATPVFAQADTASPTLSSATVEGASQQESVRLTISENLMRTNLPTAAAFTVTARGTTFAVTAVFPPTSLDPKVVVLQLSNSSLIGQGETVAVTYTDPTNGNDTNAIQDTAGNDVATFTTGMNSVPAVTNNSTITVPGAPTRLIATANGQTIINLSWTTPVSNGGSPITGYRIEISPNGVFHWTTLVADTTSTSTTYSHTGLAAGTTRYYRVSAINANGTGEPSNTRKVTTGTPVPGAPTDLSATASGTTQIDLSWTAPADDGGSPITTYGIHVSPDGRTDWRTRAGNPNTTYSQIQLAPGTTRYYRVSAANAHGLSAFSNIASATTDTTVPSPPTGLTATASGTSQINLAWMDPASNGGSAITGYKIEVSPNGTSNWTDRVTNTNSTTTNYAHTGLASGTTRHYRVSAINTNGTGEPSNTANVTTGTGTSVPGGGGTDPPGGGGAGTANNFPTADAGPDQLGVWESALVTLDGSGSSDPDDDPLRYRWNQLSGQPVVLSSQNIVNPTFTAPQGLTADAVLSFSLLVTDPEGQFDRDTVTITVDPEAEPPPAEDQIYYFPHLAVGEGWQTTITYINYSPQEVSCQTDFLSDYGTPLMVSFADQGTVVSRPDVLPPGGSVHEETNVELSAPRVAGWARATCTGPVKASFLYRRFEGGVPTGEAGVNATTVPATRFVTFAEQGEGQLGTGVAFANPSATAALVTFTARDADGEVLASDDLMLSPNGHGAQNMAPLFGLPSFTGSLEVTSTAPIVSLSLNFEAAPVFSSLPPGEVNAAAQGSITYYFPHLAVGASWQTTITYINYSSQEVSCTTEFLSDQGSPLLVSFPTKGTDISRDDVLPPGGSVHQETNVELSAPLAPGWARATCSGPVKASLLFRQHSSAGVPTGEAGVNAATVPATRFVTFAEQGEGKSGTGVAYANPSATAALVTFTARDAAGQVLASVDETLLPNGHDAQNMVDLFGLSSFTGSLEVTSTEPIVSLSLNFEAAPVFSSLPPGELDGTR